MAGSRSFWTFMMKPASVKTPCIGICSTTSVGDSICRGCKRFATEVIEWNLYSDSQKAAVLMRLSHLVEPLMEERFIIRSPRDLASGLKRLAVPYNQELPPAIWLHNLLKKRHRALTELDSFGVLVRPLWQQLSLAELAEDVDRQLLVLSQAHLDRYFPDMSDNDGRRSGVNGQGGGSV